MSFLAPFLLGLAAFAGVPLLVHLLRRRVTRRVEFPAVRFLLETEREHSRERAVRNRLLLMLRLLAVLALVAAAARPIAQLGGAGHPPIAVAIVLDQSMSTSAVVDGRTVFSRLQAGARDVAEQLSPDDRAWLVTSAGQVSAGDGGSLASQIDALMPSAGRGDLDGALRRARALVDAGAPRTPVIVVLTDGQHSALDSLVAVDNVPVIVHAPDLSVPPNRVVHAVEVQPARWAPGGRVSFTLSAPDSVSWRVLLGERTVSRGTAGSAPFASPVAIDVSAQAEDTGWLAGRVEVNADDFAGNDARAFAVLAGAPPAVFVARSAGVFVDAAVEALVADGRLRRATSGTRGAVSIAAATDEVRGPALRVAPSDPLQIVAANRTLERAGIPWRFGAVLRDTVQIANAPLRAGTSTGGATLAATRVTVRYRLARVAVAVAQDSGVIMAVAGGSPWLVAGRDYVLVASPLTVAATAAPVQAAFVPWLRDLVSQRLGDGGVLVQAAPDDTIALPVNADSLQAPDGRATAIANARLVVPGRVGVYLFRRGARTVGALVVNPEIEESNVGAWGAEMFRERLTGTSVQLEPRADAIATAVFDRAGGRSIAWPLVLLAVLALAAEALLARGVFTSRASMPASA